MKEEPIVFIVEDDEETLQRITSWVTSRGRRTRAFRTAKDFLLHYSPCQPGCLVVDLNLPGLNGPELLRALSEANLCVPAIFIARCLDVPTSVNAMKAGAVDVFCRPISEIDFLKAVQIALNKDEEARSDWSEKTMILTRLDNLSPREREVLWLVVSGMLNKQIAAALKIAEATIKVHRGRVMRKMRAQSLADLVRMADKIKPLPAKDVPEAWRPADRTRAVVRGSNARIPRRAARKAVPASLGAMLENPFLPAGYGEDSRSRGGLRMSVRRSR